MAVYVTSVGLRSATARSYDGMSKTKELNGNLMTGKRKGERMYGDGETMNGD